MLGSLVNKKLKINPYLKVAKAFFSSTVNYYWNKASHKYCENIEPSKVIASTTITYASNSEVVKLTKEFLINTQSPLGINNVHNVAGAWFIEGIKASGQEVVKGDMIVKDHFYGETFYVLDQF